MMKLGTLVIPFEKEFNYFVQIYETGRTTWYIPHYVYNWVVSVRLFFESRDLIYSTFWMPRPMLSK